MEADFTRFYQADLRALCWGDSRWGVRRLLTHIKNLPRDSAYVRRLSGAAAYWDEHVELQAQTVDELRLLTYYLLSVNGNDAAQPQTYPRPGESREPETVSLADLTNLLKE